MRRPNFILSILGMIILAIGISICSIIYWLVSNILAIVVGTGAFFLFVIFLGGMYSYFKDTKMIQKNYNEKRADELLLSLRKKTLASAGKILILMVMYGLCWGIVIWFMQTWLL